MTTVAEFITYLETLPSETTVEVLQEYTGSYYTSTCYVDLDLGKYSENCDLLGTTLHLGDK